MIAVALPSAIFDRRLSTLLVKKVKFPETAIGLGFMHLYTLLHYWFLASRFQEEWNDAYQYRDRGSVYSHINQERLHG